MTKSFKIVALAFSLTAMIMGCKEDSAKNAPEPKATVYNALAKEGNLSMTLQAIDMAGLQEVFSQDQITLFAPTDSAFNQYLKDLAVDSLTGLYNFYGATTFRNVILYHLIEKKLKGMDVVNSYISTAATNRNGNHLHAYISSINKNISLNAFEASVVERDIEVGQSIIHKVDGVLSPLTLNGLIRVNPNFSKLNSAISKSQDNLETILNQENQVHTIFGPDDAAMNSFLNSKGFADWKEFTSYNSNYTLSNLLRYHILVGETQAQSLNNGTYNTLYNNHWIELIKEQSGSINVQDEKGSSPAANIKTTDITAINGTIHIINKVLEHK